MFFASNEFAWPTTCIDWRICQISRPASGSVATIMSRPITASGITGYGTRRSFVANVLGIRKPQPNESPSRLPIEPETLSSAARFVTVCRIPKHQVTIARPARRTENEKRPVAQSPQLPEP